MPLVNCIVSSPRVALGVLERFPPRDQIACSSNAWGQQELHVFNTDICDFRVGDILFWRKVDGEHKMLRALWSGAVSYLGRNVVVLNVLRIRGIRGVGIRGVNAVLALWAVGV